MKNEKIDTKVVFINSGTEPVMLDSFNLGLEINGGIGYGFYAGKTEEFKVIKPDEIVIINKSFELNKGEVKQLTNSKCMPVNLVTQVFLTTIDIKRTGSIKVIGNLSHSNNKLLVRFSSKLLEVFNDFDKLDLNSPESIPIITGIIPISTNDTSTICDK
ncbi:MAG: hypothetical protein HWE10_01030 [Gammaproteobacteria bacterium]|nr:hypothetical protein [Gammaproteobacteria bacterium]